MNMNKAIESFRDHPELEDCDVSFVFAIEQKAYFFQGGRIYQITPQSLELASLEKPYKEVLRLNFTCTEDDFKPVKSYEDFVDFALEDKANLIVLIEDTVNIFSPQTVLDGTWLRGK